MPKSLGLTHIRLKVNNLRRSTRFYKELFGMKEIYTDEDSVYLRTAGSSRDILTLTGVPRFRRSPRTDGLDHLGFGFEKPINAKRLAEKVKKLGGKFVSVAGNTKIGRIMIFVEDPDGYSIEVYWETASFWKNVSNGAA